MGIYRTKVMKYNIMDNKDHKQKFKLSRRVEAFIDSNPDLTLIYQMYQDSLHNNAAKYSDLHDDDDEYERELVLNDAKTTTEWVSRKKKKNN